MIFKNFLEEICGFDGFTYAEKKIYSEFLRLILTNGSLWTHNKLRKLSNQIQENIKSVTDVIEFEEDGKQQLHSTVKSSCLTFLLSSILLSLVATGEVGDVNSLVNAAILYAYLDTALDHDRNGAEVRSFADGITRIINDDLKYSAKKQKKIDSYYTGKYAKSFEVYRELTGGNKSILKAAKSLLEEQIMSSFVQKMSNRKREEYKNVAKRKGSLTVYLVLEIITGGKMYPTISKAMLHHYGNIGYITQLIDDFLDVRDDLEEGIHTMATFDLAKFEYLDNYVEEVATEIRKLPEKLLLIKYVFSMGLLHAISRNVGLLTLKYFLSIEKYILFDYRCGADLIKMLEGL